MYLVLVAFKNLRRNIRRTIAIMLTIAVGVSALFCFDGFIEGVLDQYREGTIHSQYGHGQIFEKGYRDNYYEKPEDHWIRNYAEIENALRGREQIEYIFPRIRFSSLVSNGNIKLSGIGQGIDPEEEAKFFYGLNIEKGKAIQDEKEGILLGIGLAKALNLDIDDQVTLMTSAHDGQMNQIRLKVTGIFHTGLKDFDDKMFQIPIDQAKRLLKTDRIESIAIGLKSLDAWDIEAKDFMKSFPNHEAVSFEVLDKIYYQHSVTWLKSQFHTVQIIIITIVLLGIFNTISTIVLERKQEIGNLRANGESIFDVMKLLLIEGAILGFLGSCFGVLISLIFNTLFLKEGIVMPPGPGLTRDFIAYLQLKPETALFTILIGVIASFVATLLSGLKVAKMAISEALRSI